MYSHVRCQQDNYTCKSSCPKSAVTVARTGDIYIFNDWDGNIRASAKFIQEIGKHEVKMLPFHRMGASKYAQLAWDDVCRSLDPPEERMMQIRQLLA